LIFIRVMGLFCASVVNGAFAVRALTGIGTLINKILSLMERAAFSKRALTYWKEDVKSNHY